MVSAGGANSGACAGDFTVRFGHLSGGAWGDDCFINGFGAFPWVDIGPDEVGECATAFEEPEIVGRGAWSGFGRVWLVAIEHAEQASISIHYFEAKVHVEAERPGILLHGLHVAFDLTAKFFAGGDGVLVVQRGSIRACAGIQPGAEAIGHGVGERAPAVSEWCGEEFGPAGIIEAGEGGGVFGAGECEADFGGIDPEESEAKVTVELDIDGIAVMNELCRGAGAIVFITAAGEACGAMSAAV